MLMPFEWVVEDSSKDHTVTASMFYDVLATVRYTTLRGTTRRRRQNELADQLKASGALDEVFAKIDAWEPITGEQGQLGDLLQRSDLRSVRAPRKDRRDWIKARNENPKPFIWTKTADQILAPLEPPLQRINGAKH